MTIEESLPASFDNTLCWSDEDLGELDETLLLGKRAGYLNLTIIPSF